MNIKKLSRLHVLQHDHSDCGVACLSTIISYYGGSEPLAKLRELSGTSVRGTTLLGLLQAAQELGFEAKGLQAEAIENLEELSSPAILHVVVKGQLQHYYVFFGFDKSGQAIIGDPAKGIIKKAKGDLEKEWQSRSLLSLSPGGNFKKAEGRDSKRSWIKALIRDDYNLLLVALFLGFVISLLSLSTAIFSQKLFDEILPNGNYRSLFLGLALVLILLFIRSGLGYLRGLFLIKQNQSFNSRVIDYFYSSLLALPKRFFDTRKSGDLIARMNDTRRIQNVISALAGNILIDVSVTLISVTAVFFYSAMLGMASVVFLPVYFTVLLMFTKRISSGQKEVMQAHALNESNYIDTLSGIEVIKGTNKEGWFRDITRSYYGLYQGKIFDLGKINIAFGLSSEVLGAIFMITVFLTGALQVLDKALQLGEMVAVISLISTIIPAINRLTIFNIQIQEAKIAFNRMFEFTKLESENGSKEKIKASSFHELCISDLDFRFPGRKKLINGVNLSVRKGEFVAILGESGSGKSTLLQIIQKFYAPESGMIKVNGKNLEELSSNSWRDVIGVVPQHTKIFNGTVLDNICLERIDNPQKAIEFCTELGLDPLFKSLPNGYGTLVGEEGVNLSGGQQQLVSLARALYRKPQLLILDEATAAMDRRTENFILELLLSLKKEMAILMVTHRIKTASRADRIYILENGTMNSEGTPESLMLFDNFYSESYKELVLN